VLHKNRKPNSDLNKRNQIVQSKTFSESFRVNEDIRQQPGIQIAQEPFYLTEADFIKIKHDNSEITTWANRLLLGSIGFGLALLAEFINQVINPNYQGLSRGEIIAFTIAISLSIVLHILGHYVTNERKETFYAIQKHFKSAKRSKQIIDTKK
jgi:hypothetical protein